MKPYTIHMFPWNTTSGGIRCMWGLYGHLLAKGQIIQPNVQWQGESIAIYPEIAQGNPLQGTTVVRYILNTPGVMGARHPDGSFTPGPTEFDPEDHLYYFSRLFGKAKDKNHYMFLPIINTHLFKNQGKKRTKKAVLIGKGGDLGLHPKDCIVIDRNLAADQQALADLLNECEVLYVYDPVTAMTEVARLCGCRVVIFPTTYTKEEFSKYEPGLNGISFGLDEEVPLDVKGFREHYRNLKAEFSLKLGRFIESTQNA